MEPEHAPFQSSKRGGSRRWGQLVAPSAGAQDDEMEKAILIVVSRMKDYIRWKSGFNASDRAAAPLSAIVRKACDEAIRAAERDERKTVLERDVPDPR